MPQFLQTGAPVIDPASMRRCVTLVDDEPFALDILVRSAESFHFDCQTARSGEEALVLLEKQPTPIVVTDLNMPGMGGVALVQEIKKRWPQLAVIVVTAGADDEALLQCMSAGVQHYFLKPVHIDEFHHALQATWYHQLIRRQTQQQRKRLETIVHRQTHRLRHTFFSAITSLVRTLEARDAYTSGHSLRVRKFAVRLAKYIGLDEHNMKRLSLAAKLHDIGKVGLAEGILNKPAKLSADEFDRVKEHPVIGERILRPIVRNRVVLAAIRGHHERFDGAGYPDGLRGEEIPFLARIITIADCYDAMTSSRAYRGAMSPDAALGILHAGHGTQFDPHLVPPFLRMMREAKTRAKVR
ncbi:MAG: response regulator [Planctomycetes bacterium]|nr:response regulator [Planctomycetota bacterium]